MRYNYRYCLPHSEVRLDELLDFCRAERIDAVQFYVNIDPAASYYMPAATAAEQIPYAEWLRTAVAPRLCAAGIGFQLNFQMLLGAFPGGLDLRSRYGWGCLVDQHGEENPGCACPLDPVFRDKMGGMLALWGGVGADVIWIDDDFRLHNHQWQPAEPDYYCFCSRHLRQFAVYTGREYSREELIARILRPGRPDPVREQWFDFLGATMTETAAWIRGCVPASVRLALMTSLPDVHAAEGRPWQPLLRALSGPHFPPLTRPCCGIYQGSGGALKDNTLTFRTLFQSTDTLRREAGPGAEWAPELENTRFTRFSKSWTHTLFQLTLGALTGAGEITLSLHDLDGSPIAPVGLAGVKERLAALTADGWNGCGIRFLNGTGIVRRRELSPGARYHDLIPSRAMESVLLGCGIPGCYGGFEPGVLTLLEAETAQALTEEELACLSETPLILTGGAALVLQNRGLGELLGVKIRPGGGQLLQSERYPDGTRIPHRGALVYELEAAGAQVLSEAVDFAGVWHIAGVRHRNVMIWNGDGEMRSGCFAAPRRLQWLHEQIRFLDGNAFPVFVTPDEHMLTVQFRRGSRCLLAAANLGTDPVTRLELAFPGGEASDLEELDRHGRWRPGTNLNAPLHALEWVILRWRDA